MLAYGMSMPFIGATAENFEEDSSHGKRLIHDYLRVEMCATSIFSTSCAQQGKVPRKHLDGGKKLKHGGSGHLFSCRS